jgi:hypothetical protein
VRRVPVVATIREAWLFTFSHLGNVIGLIWVPMVMITVAQFFTFLRYYNAMIDYLAGGGTAQLGPSTLMLIGYIAAAMLLYAIMLVAVVQLVLGSRAGGVIAHFAFGPLEWRMARAFFAYTGLLLLIGLGVMMLANLAMAAGGPKFSQGAASGFLMLGLLGACVILVPRFLILMPAVSVNETGPVLRRTWALSAGNFLRLLGILLGLFLPLAVLLGVADIAIGGHQAAVAGDDRMKMLQALTEARSSLPVACGLTFLVSPLVVGLFASASVSAWRALKDEPTVELIA